MAITGRAAMNMRCAYLSELYFCLGIYSGVGLLGPMATLLLVFEELPYCCSLVAVPICVPTDSVRVLPFLHTLSSIYRWYIFNDGHSDWCDVGPHCFDLHFSND